MTYLNDAVLKIVSESEEIDNIMNDLLLEIPKLFENINYTAVKYIVVTYICNPRPFTNNSEISEKFEKILKKHLKSKYKTKKSENQKMADTLRKKVRDIIKGECKDTNFLRLLGCSSKDFLEHIEVGFQEGMTWDNYGEWHIDHIEPLCSFDLTDTDQISKATNFSNLRPLWAEENITKGRISDKHKSIRKNIR